MLEDAVHAITADESRWVDIMLHNEYGLSLHRNSPTLAATMTFVSFMFVGAVPLLPFLIQWLRGGNVSQFWVSATLTGIAFFAIGAIKASFVAQRWWWSGGETLLVGSLAALLAYLCGYLLSGLV
jgi:VIT1/CCC1 family predicted Fe2+/Mn2+ transporter